MVQLVEDSSIVVAVFNQIENLLIGDVPELVVEERREPIRDWNLVLFDVEKSTLDLFFCHRGAQTRAVCCTKSREIGPKRMKCSSIWNRGIQLFKVIDDNAIEVVLVLNPLTPDIPQPFNHVSSSVSNGRRGKFWCCGLRLSTMNCTISASIALLLDLEYYYTQGEEFAPI